MHNTTDPAAYDRAQATWIPPSDANAVHPHMTDDFARVYEMTANRITGQIAAAALDLVRDVRWGARVLDIAAGAGALSVPAALRGAAVLAIDSAPGMVNLLSSRLAPFPTSSARLMDGQSLALESQTFDATFSIIGASIFPDWREGLAEQVRVTRKGGKACVATWRTPPGGGPFLVMAQALHSVYPDVPPPVPPEGFVALADPGRLRTELEQAGLRNLEIEEIVVTWDGPAGPSYLDDVRALHGYMGAYAALNANERRRVDEAIITIVDRLASNGQVKLDSSVVLASGTRR